LFSNAILPSKVAVLAASLMGCTNGKHLFSRQDSLGMAHTMGRSTFLGHIALVIRHCSSK